MIIDEKIAAQLPAWQERVKKLVSEYGTKKVCEITVEQIFGGMRGVHVQVSDISYLDPYRGITYRGYTIQEMIAQLPKATGSEYPLAGGLYYLLMTNELPNLEQALEVEDEWRKRSPVPGYVLDLIDTLPTKTHPMTMFSAGHPGAAERVALLIAVFRRPAQARLLARHPGRRPQPDRQAALHRGIHLQPQVPQWGLHRARQRPGLER